MQGWSVGIGVMLALGSAQAQPAGVCPNGRININQADVVALSQVRGVGKRRAAAIVADRKAKGPFARVDALDRVKGLKAERVAQWAPRLTTRCSRTALPATTVAGRDNPEAGRKALPATTVAGRGNPDAGRKALPATTVAGRDNPDGRKALPATTVAGRTSPGQQRVNVNTASASALARVKGITPRVARAIVALRLQKKGFKRLEELTEVDGITSATLARIRGRLSLK